MTGPTAGAGPDVHQAALAEAVAAVLDRLDDHARKTGAKGTPVQPDTIVALPPDSGAGPDSTARLESHGQWSLLGRRRREQVRRAGGDQREGRDPTTPGPGPGGGPAPAASPGAAAPAAPHEAAGPGTAASAANDGAAGRSALETLCGCFGLTAFERDVLVLAAAAELDSTTAGRCAAASGEARRPCPTFSLALAALAEPHWSAITPVAPLRRWRLVELDDETTLTTSRLRADERILHFLTGLPYLDPRLRGTLSRAEPPADPPSAYRQVTAALAARWTSAAKDEPPHAEISGSDTQTRRDIAAVAARQAGLGAYTIRDADLPADPAERDALARLWEREAILLPAALLAEVNDPDRLPLADSFCAGLAVPAALSGDEPAPLTWMRVERVEVPPLGADEQLRLWQSALNGVRGEGPATTDAGLRQLVTQFSLPAHVIRSAGASVCRQLAADRPDTGGGEPAADISRLAWQAGLAEARVALDQLGRRVEPGAGWDDLVVPEQQRLILAEVTTHVRQRAAVYQDWGFEAVLRRGLGVAALFAGGSGTGKTLAAEVIAHELGLDLFVIDLSQVVSKYIGETEKNLHQVFDAAERGGAVLLFDEADALFGKRTEVKDSHDRYANIEVSYLLMRMEAYRGLAILTTNMKNALDPAFMRRIRFVVEFPFPGAAEREQIWHRVIPSRVPVRDLDFGRLAQLTVAGGTIRNIALSAAFLAADENAPLKMRHLLAASRTEYLKLERSLPAGEVTGWE